MKFCQPGVDEWNLPAWCVEQNFEIGMWLQVFTEIGGLILLFLITKKLTKQLKKTYNRWKKRKEPLNKWEDPF